MTYSEKLKDPRWQKKRLEIMQRDNFTCKLCGDTKETLHIHHSRYKGTPWQADDEHLHTICATCHRFMTYKEKDEGVVRIIKTTFEEGDRVCFCHTSKGFFIYTINNGNATRYELGSRFMNELRTLLNASNEEK